MTSTIYLSVHLLSLYRSICLSNYLSSIYLFVCLYLSNMSNTTALAIAFSPVVLLGQRAESDAVFESSSR